MHATSVARKSPGTAFALVPALLSWQPTREPTTRNPPLCNGVLRQQESAVLNTLITYSIQSLGLIPLLAFIFLIGIAIIIERFMFFTRAVRAGNTLEHDLKLVDSSNLEDAAKVAEH